MSDGSYYMDQTKMLDNIIKETNMTGAKDEHLPSPTTGNSLSKLDNSTLEDKAQCDEYPYRKVIGMLMYCLVHTGITYMYAINVLSRYCNSPGKKHIEFMKHLLCYVTWTARDRPAFRAHPGPRTEQQIRDDVTLVFYADADLGGNPDNMHSQTSCIGYCCGNVIAWRSTDQGSVSTSTAESEIKAINFALKAEVIACRGILIAMGFPQQPTPMYEDNQACVYASNHEHMTKNLRHLELTEMWFKQEVAKGTCVLVKIDSKLNVADIGTKRLNNPLFADLTCTLVDRSLRTNL